MTDFKNFQSNRRESLYYYNGKYGVSFVFDEPVESEVHEGCVQAILSDPARAIAATIVAMHGTEAHTAGNRALLRRYMVGLGLESPQDGVQAEADVGDWRAALAGKIGRRPSDAEVAEAMLAMLRAVESDVFARGGAK
ncbi:hypothetical protein B2G69_00315 [Methylorubrum zatmanii]|nr:ferredoxin [Methylorubrum zatmanii]ARO52735.1 hypothetical protein B2G69_00315 [Methylorubrum zatmanii]